jgi:hypothetical protein
MNYTKFVNLEVNLTLFNLFNSLALFLQISLTMSLTSACFSAALFRQIIIIHNSRKRENLCAGVLSMDVGLRLPAHFHCRIFFFAAVN